MSGTARLNQRSNGGHLSSLFCFPMLWVMLWVKVKSHAGIAGNECADAIANDQASQANKKCG
eukprot:scaffold214915_cov17-Tisochrysis_lutea.AAC.1